MCVFLLVSRTWVFIIAAERVSRISVVAKRSGGTKVLEKERDW